VQFMPIETQLHLMTAALKEQFPRHCFIKIQQHDTSHFWYPTWRMSPFPERIASGGSTSPCRRPQPCPPPSSTACSRCRNRPCCCPSDWTPRSSRAAAQPLAPEPSSQRRGPKVKVEEHRKVAAIVTSYGNRWKDAEALLEICERLDREKVPSPNKWLSLSPPLRTWQKALSIDPDRVRKVIEYRSKKGGT